MLLRSPAWTNHYFLKLGDYFSSWLLLQKCGWCSYSLLITTQNESMITKSTIFLQFCESEYMVAVSLKSVDYTNERFWICGVLALEIGLTALTFFLFFLVPSSHDLINCNKNHTNKAISLYSPGWKKKLHSVCSKIIIILPSSSFSLSSYWISYTFYTVFGTFLPKTS